MVAIVTTPAKLGGQLRGRNRSVLRAIARGALRGAERGRAIVVRETPVDQAQLKGAWKVIPGDRNLLTATSLAARVVKFVLGMTLAELRNSAPHAGIVELGARPHKTSVEGWLAIYDWVVRHRAELGLTTKSGKARRVRKDGVRVHPGLPNAGQDLDAEIAGITWAIVIKLEREGQEPTYFVKGCLPALHQAVEVEVEKAIGEVARTKPPPASPGGP